MKIKLRERAKVQNNIEVTHQKDETSSFELLIIYVHPHGMLIDENIEYEDVNQLGDTVNKDGKE